MVMPQRPEVWFLNPAIAQKMPMQQTPCWQLAECRRMSQNISSFSSKVQAFAKLNCYFSFSASRDPGDPGEPVGPSDDAWDILVFVESYWVSEWFYDVVCVEVT